MLPEFRSQLSQLPLISTTWTCVRKRYLDKKQNSLMPIRFILSTIEKLILFIHKNFVHPMINPHNVHLNQLDYFLSSHIDSIRSICPIVDRTSDELIEYYGDQFHLSFMNKNSISSSIANNIKNIHKEKRLQFFQSYFQFLTNILIIIEIYSKSIRNELHSYIDVSRNIWKNMNMVDGRTLDEVESYSEKLFVLGRRITGNYRQLIYLIRGQLKRCRSILFSCSQIQRCLISVAWRTIQKIQMNQSFINRTQFGLITSKERICHYLEVVMFHAAQHPWMRWKPFQGLFKSMGFNVSMNTSNCCGYEEHVQYQSREILTSTPYRKTSNLIQFETPIDDDLSATSSLSSSIPEQSFDVQDILQQAGQESCRSPHTNSSTNHDNENQAIRAALDQTDDSEQQEFVSILNLSPTLTSRYAISKEQ